MLQELKGLCWHPCQVHQNTYVSVLYLEKNHGCCAPSPALSLTPGFVSAVTCRHVSSVHYEVLSLTKPGEMQGLIMSRCAAEMDFSASMPSTTQFH